MFLGTLLRLHKGWCQIPEICLSSEWTENSSIASTVSEFSEGGCLLSVLAKQIMDTPMQEKLPHCQLRNTLQLTYIQIRQSQMRQHMETKLIATKGDVYDDVTCSVSQNGFKGKAWVIFFTVLDCRDEKNVTLLWWKFITQLRFVDASLMWRSTLILAQRSMVSPLRRCWKSIPDLKVERQDQGSHMGIRQVDGGIRRKKWKGLKLDLTLCADDVDTRKSYLKL